MVQEVLIYLSLIIATAAILTIIARIIRQPPIIAYLVAGVLVGPLVFNLIGPSSSSSVMIGTFAHIGVAFLLFIVGLNLDFKVLKEVGIVSVFSGFFEIFITGIAGFFIALAIGFSNIPALYIGAALAFSSTVVVVKILSDKKEIDTLHGKIALGILIVEDFVAGIALMIVPLINNHTTLSALFIKIGMVVGLILLIILFTVFIMRRILGYLAKNQEVLFLFGIAWALILASLFDYLGFSLEIGALIAGMSLASSKYTLELGGKIKPLRDFFVVLFFVFFGSQLAGDLSLAMIRNAILISIFILIGKPLIVMTVLRIFGYKKKTNFLAGSSIAQISEFSLILILLGYTLGHLNQDVMGLVILVAIITIGLSSYSIYYSHKIFNKISHLLNMFEGKKFEKESLKEEKFDIILFGYHRMGYKVIESIKELKEKYAVVDYNPKVILALSSKKINCIYGDAGDRNFLSEIPIEKAKLIISTIPDKEVNFVIKEMLREKGGSAVFIATAEQPRIAIDLYEEGVDYVLIPHHLGGEYAAELLKKYKTDKKKYAERGRQHLKELNKARNNSSFE
jgi:Kef-type K+ transport system membrane component KefB/Trk K+ transport system NAD-binding subunit